MLKYCYIGISILLTQALSQKHPLVEYVEYVDPEYNYVEIGRYETDQSNIYSLNVTSQRWMTEEFSTQSIWFHYVTVVVPKVVTIPDAALLFVGVGQMDDDPPAPGSNVFIPLLEEISQQTGAPTTMVSQTPNQPIAFYDDPDFRPRTEDDIIAFTWAKYMNMSEVGDDSRDPSMLLYFPMVKGIVRSMDSISDFLLGETGQTLDKYIITGPSKRGWTTWLTGALDSRVIGLAPQVLSCLDLVPNFKHHQMSLGGWSWAVEDYWREGVLERMDEPSAQEVAYLQDPLVFLENYTMPKMVVKASKDEFFMIDDTQFFFDRLPGVSYMWVLENSVHVMVGHWDRLVNNTASFMLNTYYDLAWPQFTFDLESSETTASIVVNVDTSNTLLEDIVVWRANTAQDERRDWRWVMLGQEINNVTWTEDIPEDQGDGQYSIEYTTPEDGSWLGFFMTMTFRGEAGTPMEDRVIEFSTEVNIVPDVYLHEPCSGREECRGELL